MNKWILTAATVFGLLITSPVITAQALAADQGFGQLFTDEAPPALGGRDPLAGSSNVAETAADTDFFGRIEPAAGDDQERADDFEASEAEDEMPAEDPLATSEN